MTYLNVKIGCCVGLLLITSCTARQPANPDVVARIERICMSTGLFKLVDGAIALAVPVASIPIALINAGVDRVCMDPERFASDAATVKWLLKNLNRPES